MYKRRTKRFVGFDAWWNVEIQKCLQCFSLYSFQISVLILWIQLYIWFHLKMRLYLDMLILCINKFFVYLYDFMVHVIWFTLKSKIASSNYIFNQNLV
jgi:hypothetical protein